GRSGRGWATAGSRRGGGRASWKREYQARPTRLKVAGSTVRTGPRRLTERPPGGSSMIIRLWTAHATPEGAARSQGRFVEKILPTLTPLDGYLGASFLRRIVGDEVELVLLTRWKSLESIRAFAGDDIERAVVAEDAATMLKRWDARV